MSAFIVTKLHVDLLLRVAAEGPRDGAGQWFRPSWAGNGMADELAFAGRVLWSENVRSVAARYPHDAAGELPGAEADSWRALGETFNGYLYERPAVRLSVAEALKALDCLEYQSCECEDYRSTKAYEMLDALRGSLIHSLPGYDAAPWAWDGARAGIRATERTV